MRPALLLLVGCLGTGAAGLFASKECPTSMLGPVGGFVTLLGNTVNSVFQAFTTDIGGRSDECFLPITPSTATFSIWGYLYSQTALLLALLACDDAFLHATKSSTRWVEAWSSDNLLAARDALHDTYKALVESAQNECARSPWLYARDTTATCCFLSQYATWAYSAYLQNEQIVQIYGDSDCDANAFDPLRRRLSIDLNASEVETMRYEYLEHMATFVLELPEHGQPYGAKTFQWTASGICDSCSEDSEYWPPLTYNGSEASCSAICAVGRFVVSNVTEGDFGRRLRRIRTEGDDSYGFAIDACAAPDTQVEELLEYLSDEYMNDSEPQ